MLPNTPGVCSVSSLEELVSPNGQHATSVPAAAYGTAVEHKGRHAPAVGSSWGAASASPPCAVPSPSPSPAAAPAAAPELRRRWSWPAGRLSGAHTVGTLHHSMLEIRPSALTGVNHRDMRPWRQGSLTPDVGLHLLQGIQRAVAGLGAAADGAVAVAHDGRGPSRLQVDGVCVGAAQNLRHHLTRSRLRAFFYRLHVNLQLESYACGKASSLFILRLDGKGTCAGDLSVCASCFFSSFSCDRFGNTTWIVAS